MEKLDELKSSQKISLDLLSKKNVLIFLIVVLVLITTFVLVWIFAFKGLVHNQLKKQVGEIYNQVVLNGDKNFCDEEVFTKKGKKNCQNLYNTIHEELYKDKEQIFKFTPLAINESVSVDDGNPIFIITDPTFTDQRNITDSIKVTPTIWFFYLVVGDDYFIDSILYLKKDVEQINK